MFLLNVPRMCHFSILPTTANKINFSFHGKETIVSRYHSELLGSSQKGLCLEHSENLAGESFCMPLALFLIFDVLFRPVKYEKLFAIASRKWRKQGGRKKSLTFSWRKLSWQSESLFSKEAKKKACEMAEKKGQKRKIERCFDFFFPTSHRQFNPFLHNENLSLSISF